MRATIMHGARDVRIETVPDPELIEPSDAVVRVNMQHGHIAIPKSARPERMAENLNVFDFELAPEQMTAIDALDKGESGRVGPNPDTYEGV